MKVIILAAGKGSRLGFGELPKPLTPLANGKSILENQLMNLVNQVSLDQVIVVVGYHKEMIMEAFPGLLYVFNPDYANENTAKSLLRALRKVEEDVLWLNGDVVFHPSVLQRLLATKENGMVVNVGSVGDEEVKYTTDSDGLIVEISKQVAEPQGEALGINFFKADDVHHLRTALEWCHQKDYFEKGVELSIREGTEVRAVEVEANLCTEVDFPEDLERANKLLSQWSF